MKTFFAITTALAIAASSAFAQGAVSGEPTGRTSGNPEFPVEVLGTDGNIYNCSANIVLRNGTRVQRCTSPRSTSGLFEAGGLGGGAGPLILFAFIGAAAAAGGGGSTNGTN